MIVVKNNILPFKGFQAITLFPFIFTRSDMDANTLNHENIHGRQQLELFILGFYVVYLVEWIVKGYENISFEKESYDNAENLDYLKTRKHFAMWRNKKI